MGPVGFIEDTSAKKKGRSCSKKLINITFVADWISCCFFDQLCVFWEYLQIITFRNNALIEILPSSLRALLKCFSIFNFRIVNAKLGFSQNFRIVF